MREHLTEGAGEVSGSSLSERPHEGQDEAQAGYGPARGAQTPQAQEGQVCHHLAQLRTYSVQRYREFIAQTHILIHVAAVIVADDEWPVVLM